MDPSPDVRWLEPEEDAAWRAWLAMSELLRAQMARDLQAYSGLSEPDYAVLVRLSERPDHRIRMSDLAADLRWSRSRLSHQLARMEVRGLVAKQGCPSDARGWFAVLTAVGMEEVRAAAPLHVASVRRHFLDRLAAAQIGQLRAIAEAVVGPLLTGDTVIPDTVTPDAPKG